MQFEIFFKKVLTEVKKETLEFSPWSLEITKDLNKSEEYNLLGELIIRLSILRSKMN